MRCQSANLDLKFIFHQLMSSDCNIVRQLITQQWAGQLFSMQKKIKSTPRFPRFRDIFIFSSQLSVTAQHLGVTLILCCTGSSHAPDTLGRCLGPLSYQTYQIFNNKHLNRSSLSALRTNDPPWWLCSSSPILDTEIQPLILIRNVHSIKTLQIAAAITSLMSRTLMSNVIN